MTTLETLLPVVWIGLIGIAVAMYVVLDGFDLGIGILFPGFGDERERDLAMNSVAPFWDGNETWLVLGGAGLLVAFPAAYAMVMPAFYEPVIVLLLGLIFRGVAFEFRWVAKPHHGIWDAAFVGGSVAAAFAQGVILGGLVQGAGFLPEGTGATLAWATPFAVFCGFGLVAGYALLGATWLMMRTEGTVEAAARRWAGPLVVLVALFAAGVSLWTPLMSTRIAERWFSPSNLVLLWPLPAATAGLLVLVARGIRNGDERLPFFGTIGVFLLCLAGLAISSFPYIVPPGLTIWQAAAVPDSQIFSLVGALVMLPVILAYTVFAYWTFRGKLKAGDGYH